MKRLPILACAVAACAIAGESNAAQRTFVASTGNDANACSLAAPCRGFAAALAKTDSGGEVIVLDSAGYGTITITQSVSIIAPPGVYAGISVASGDGVTISGSGIDVVLSGLAINGQGGNRGVFFIHGASVVVERCTISNMAADGIVLQSVSGGAVTIVDSVVASNGGIGIVVANINLTVQIERTRIEANAGDAVFLGNQSVVTISDSVVARNGGFGPRVYFGGGTAKLAIDRSTIVDNGTNYVRDNGTDDGGHTADTRI